MAESSESSVGAPIGPGPGGSRGHVESSRPGGWGRRLAILTVLTFVMLLVALGTLRAFWSNTRPGSLEIADVSSERLLGFGSVVGFAAAHETHAWLGIPFARPPVEALRWRAPQPPEAWADTFDALKPGSPCPQLSSSIGGVASSHPEGFAGEEDCLYLNVWAPRAEPEDTPRGADRLPVMVWIHGGGNRKGDGASSMYDGSRLAGTQDVVVVTFNYRLGPFGWFSHPAIRASAANAGEASGNFGTLDQIRALEWVRANIGEFGGDPDNVTIFGESAGGTNVLTLMLAKGTRGLFHRAIAQSGSTDSVSRAEAENPLDAEQPGHVHSSSEITVALLVREGAVPDRVAARRYAAELPPEDLAEYLRGRSTDEILDAYRDPEKDDAITLPRLIRDGVLLPEDDWLEAFREGRFTPVPTLLGSNRDEMKLYFALDEEHVPRRFGFLPRVRDVADYERRSRYHSDLWKARAVDEPAAAISESGRVPVYAYRFDWDEEPRRFGVELSTILGAAHGFEIPFVFGNFDLGDPLLNAAIFEGDSVASRERLSVRMMGYWAEFARTGQPGRGGREDAPEWLAWSDRISPRANVLVLDTEEGGGIRVASKLASRDHVIASVVAEPDLAEDEKCALLLDLFVDRPGWDIDEYRRMGHGGCADSYVPEILPEVLPDLIQ